MQLSTLTQILKQYDTEKGFFRRLFWDQSDIRKLRKYLLQCRAAKMNDDNFLSIEQKTELFRILCMSSTSGNKASARAFNVLSLNLQTSSFLDASTQLSKRKISNLLPENTLENWIQLFKARFFFNDIETALKNIKDCNGKEPYKKYFDFICINTKGANYPISILEEFNTKSLNAYDILLNNPRIGDDLEENPEYLEALRVANSELKKCDDSSYYHDKHFLKICRQLKYINEINTVILELNQAKLSKYLDAILRMLKKKSYGELYNRIYLKHIYLIIIELEKCNLATYDNVNSINYVYNENSSILASLQELFANLREGNIATQANFKRVCKIAKDRTVGSKNPIHVLSNWMSMLSRFELVTQDNFDSVLNNIDNAYNISSDFSRILERILVKFHQHNLCNQANLNSICNVTILAIMSDNIRVFEALPLTQERFDRLMEFINNQPNPETASSAIKIYLNQYLSHYLSTSELTTTSLIYLFSLLRRSIPVQAQGVNVNTTAKASVNYGQSIHNETVERSIDESVLRLKSAYNNLTENQDEVEACLKAIKVFAEGIQTENNPKNEAAQRALLYWVDKKRNKDYIHKGSKLTIPTALALVWQAMHDDSRRDKDATLDDAKNRLLEQMYEIQRAYNLDENGKEIDSDAADNATCVKGTFNKIMITLHTIHPDVQINFMSNMSAAIKLQELIQSTLRDYIKNLSSEDALEKIKLIEKSEDNIPNQIWKDILKTIKGQFFDEFKPLFKEQNQYFNDFMEAGRSVDIQHLLQELKKIIPASSDKSEVLPSEQTKLIGLGQYGQFAQPQSPITTEKDKNNNKESCVNNVSIKTLTGKSFLLDISDAKTVTSLEIKEQIFKRKGIEIADQSIVICGSRWPDAQTYSEFCTNNPQLQLPPAVWQNAILHLVIKKTNSELVNLLKMDYQTLNAHNSSLMTEISKLTRTERFKLNNGADLEKYWNNLDLNERETILNNPQIASLISSENRKEAEDIQRYGFGK